MKLFPKARLRTRLLGVVVALAAINIIIALGLLWYSDRTDAIFTGLMDEAALGLVLAEELTTSLASQKGFASYYYIDHNPAWIEQIEKQRLRFRQCLARAMAVDTISRSRAVLAQIDREFQLYSKRKGLVIDLYQAADYDAGRALHEEVRTHFEQLLALCNQYVETKRSQMYDEVAGFRTQVTRLRTTVVVLVVIGLTLLGGLVLLLQKEVLGPIRRMSTEAAQSLEPRDGSDEIAALGTQVRELVEHVDLSQAEVERSRSRLIKSEKLAVVGRLAAEVAHSIRGPMTSIGLRLYSLEQAGRFTESQAEDLQAIRDDLNYLDNIIRSFLELSRPPKLKRTLHSVPVLVSQCLQLLEHTLDKHKVRVNRKHSTMPLQCEVDCELLKEAFINLIINACEAMTDGGTLIVREYFTNDHEVGEAVVVEISDTGSGLDEEVARRLFEPFVTTKDEGTGLGLSISSRIAREHGGRLRATSRKGVGATFTVVIPAVKG